MHSSDQNILLIIKTIINYSLNIPKTNQVEQMLAMLPEQMTALESLQVVVS